MTINRFVTISYFTFLYLFILSSMTGQEKIKPKDRWGIGISHGNQQWLNVDYSYEVNIVGAQYLKTVNSNNSLNFSFFFQPIFGISDYLLQVSPNIVTRGYEYGVGIGGRLDIKLWSRLNGFVSIQSGPHYITNCPERQDPGFLFSSSAGSGINYSIGRSTSIELILGFRHMSNAEVRQPNGGINNLLLGIGVLIEK